MSTMHYPHAGRGTTRTGASGLRIRTHTFTDVSSSNVKAKGMASADWRKSTSTGSPPGEFVEKASSSKRNYETRSSHSSSSPMEVEMEDMAHKNLSYRPMQQQAPWDMLVSAPGRSFARSSISSGKFVCEGLPVKLTSAKTMTMNVNGEEITLENSFTFDVITLDSDQSSSGDDSSWATVGVLKRANSRNHHRKLSRGHDASDLPLDIQSMLNRSLLDRLRDRSSLESQRTEQHNEGRMGSQGQAKADNGTSHDRSASKRPSSSLPRAQVSLSEEEQWRYQSILNRLNKVPLVSDVFQRPIRDVKSSDPAIVAAKVKESTKPPEISSSSVPRPRSDWSRRAQQDSSLESDQRSSGSLSSGWTRAGSCASSVGSLFSSEGTKSIGTTVLHPIKESESKEPALESPTKRLNPAAAEFKSTFDANAFPISPKKMTRTPLTNLFPEATQKLLVTPADPPASREHGGDQVPDSIVAQAPQAPPLAPYNTLPSLAGLRPPPPGFGLAKDGAYTTGPQTLPHLPPLPLQAPYLGSLFDTYPTPTLLPPPVDLVQMQLANMSGFGTFPGTALPLPGPIPAPRANPAVGMAPLGAPVQYSTAPCPPLFGPDRKINRPPFPVTQKPRDHDPVKQQQYEQYLEWRKANEPGYHMRCKMRQAQRVVRQYQQQKLDRSSNPAWKSIVEKAKAAVGAAAEAAAAEKRMMQESVRAELKAKVKERSEDSTKSDENTPPTKLMTPVAKKARDPCLSKSEMSETLADGPRKHVGTKKQKSE
ncbi:hypothetical protein B0T14DRAFT_570195 [Immersiella caudata]|uniref:Uncharacterized protein n=1 Tax=Immersiella caudata TaxID=314043 RepID=A0AA40BUM5_9PEZI|nr:hypothetical protein B0T14DRAFT_570195 [Immersiella caudata]